MFPVERAQLPKWIRARLAAHGVTVDDDGAELLADRVEGNLLAAQQEIERIVLLRPGAQLDAAAVAELVADNARYDVFELSAAAMTGNASRALQDPRGPEGRGRRAAVHHLGAGQRPARRLAGAAATRRSDRSLDEAMRNAQVWSNRKVTVQAGMRRLDEARIRSLLLAAARADRVAKGSLRGDAWVEIEGLVARIAGVPLAA